MGPHQNRAALAGRPKLEVAEIFRYHRDLLGPLHRHTAKVVRDIMDCRTAKLGGHLRRCDQEGCGHEEISYNSCRNRHCPKCQFLARAEWVHARAGELLPVEYFHVVFTIPHEFNPLVLQNKKSLYELLFRAASQTLKEVSERNWNAQAGFIAVLHTWSQNLLDHPHIHMIVPGGGLRRNPDGTDEWIPCPKAYLLPLKILSEVFRAKFLAGLQAMHGELMFLGKLQSLSRVGRFNQLLKTVAQKNWVVYAKKPFNGPEQVLRYLGNYTHRIAISNHRLLKIENGRVHFRYRDSKDQSKHKVMSVSIEEFMRRFLLHVLPPKFVRIRHFGFLGNRFRKDKLKRCKALLIPGNEQEHKEPEDKKLIPKPCWQERLKNLTGIDISLCSKCKCGRMREMRSFDSFYERRRRFQKVKWMDTS